MEAARIEAPPPPASLDVYFVDVGKGDGIVLDYGDVEIVVDAGQGRTAMRDFLSSHALVEHEPGDVPVIELVVLTHPDPDHYGGFPALAKRYAVREVWDPGYDRTDRRGYREALEGLRQANHGGPEVVMKRPLECYHTPIAHPGVDANARFVGSDAGVALRVGNDLLLRLLYAARDPRSSKQGIGFLGVGSRNAYLTNNSSIVLAVEYAGRTRVLLTGDINGRVRRRRDTPAEVEKLLLEQARPYLRAEVLKVPHHGSDSANTPAFIQAVSPRFTVTQPHHWLGIGGPPARKVTRLYERRPHSTHLQTGSKRQRPHVLCRFVGPRTECAPFP